MVLFLFNNVIYVFLLLWLRILIVCLCMTTLTESFPCFLLSCKANARVKPAKDVARPALFLIYVVYILWFVLFSVLFLCVCVPYYYHRVATQFQLNISYRILSKIGLCLLYLTWNFLVYVHLFCIEIFGLISRNNCELFQISKLSPQLFFD
jgi:hypothetical protein